MDVITELKAKLDAYPEIRYTATVDSIAVPPQDQAGFTVGLRISGVEYTVHFDGWHERFTSPDEALNCFAFGLSEACRLTVTYRGSMPTKWVVESLEGDRWIPDSETGLLLFPFWRRPNVVHKRNHVLRAA